MMVLVRQQQLMQRVPSPPSVLYGIDRRNLGYSGPTVTVRRASDNGTRDCYSQADITSYCTGTNGFVTVAYDQTGAGRHISQSTQTKQPKCYDSGTGLVLAGKIASMTYVAASQQTLWRQPEAAGFSNGDVAFTIAYSTSAFTFPGSSVVMVQCGPDTGGGNQDTFYTGRNTSISLYTADRAGNVVRNFNVNPDSTKQYVVVSKAAAANYNTCVIRQNGSLLSTGSQVSGTLNFTVSNSILCWGSAFTIQQFCDATAQMMAMWTSQLAGQDLATIESVLEAERTTV